MTNNKLIGISEFVKRQTRDSQFTNYVGTWEELEEMLNNLWKADDFIDVKDGYRDGVKLVSVNPHYFFTYTDYPMFEGMKMECRWAKTPGREHEPAKLQVYIREPKIKCNYVDVVLYRKDVLEEDGDESTGAKWDVVSINGRLQKDPKPMDAITIVRNWLHLKGGTEMKGATPESVLDMLCETVLYKNGMKKQWKKILGSRQE
jgi:hypothetical protein